MPTRVVWFLCIWHSTYVKPIFNRLGSCSLFKDVCWVPHRSRMKASTVHFEPLFQDWLQFSKVKLSVNIALLTYNGGTRQLTAILRELGIQLGPLGLCSLASKDSERAESKALPGAKQKIKLHHKEQLVQEAALAEKEGPLYNSGAFWVIHVECKNCCSVCEYCCRT